MSEVLTSDIPGSEDVFMDVKYTKIQTAGCNAPLKITPVILQPIMHISIIILI